MIDTLLDDILLDRISTPFALIARVHKSKEEPEVEILSGPVFDYEFLRDLPGKPSSQVLKGRIVQQLLVMVPYQQIRERGFDVIEDGESLKAMHIQRQQSCLLREVISKISLSPLKLEDQTFDIEDEEYGQIVEQIIRREIGNGEGSNFVLSRSLYAQIRNYSLAKKLSIFRKLLEIESGAYWTFFIDLRDRAFIGATPERHISMAGGKVVMNPISGTYRYPSTGPSLEGLKTFLNDQKEVDELNMVADEELKMMAQFCPTGGRLAGPFLKEMSRVAHTEYLLEGETHVPAWKVLHHTLLAPTVTGSPLENACRAIARYEKKGRGYYAGVVALIGQDSAGEEVLDSAILIRTADVTAEGKVRLTVGATIVRHSSLADEAAETKAKAEALLSAFAADQSKGFANHPELCVALEERNKTTAQFWRQGDQSRKVNPRLAGRKVLIIDAEDAFTHMLAQQLASIGLNTVVRSVTEAGELDFDEEFIVLGPGPGNPEDLTDKRICGLSEKVDTLLAGRKPFMAVCLSHQILCSRLGLQLARRREPNQGVQRKIEFFGNEAIVGFYNTYVAHSNQDEFVFDNEIKILACRDRESSEVHALRGPYFSSFQFHAESLLSFHGLEMIENEIGRLLL